MVDGERDAPLLRCPECGAGTSGAFRFCGSCGHRLAPTVREDPATADPAAGPDLPELPGRPGRTRGRTPTGRVLAAVLVVAVGVTAAVALRNREVDPPPPGDAGDRDAAGGLGAPPDVLAGDAVQQRWEERWTDDPPGARHPAVRPVAVGAGLLVEGDGVLALLDRTDRRVRWRSELDVGGTAPALPIDERLVAVAGRAEVSLVDTADGTRPWRTAVPGIGTVTGLAAVGRTLLVTGSNGGVAVVDLGRGTRRASVSGRDLLGGQGPFRIGPFRIGFPPVVVGERVAAIVTRLSDGTAHVVMIDRDGRAVWVSPEPVVPSWPPVAGDGVVVASGVAGEVVAFDASTGEVRWRRDPDGGGDPMQVRAVAASPDGATVLVVTAAGARRVLAARTGAFVTGQDAEPLAPYPVPGSPDRAGRLAVVTDRPGIDVVDVTTGRTVWSAPRSTPREGLPVLDRDQVVIGLPGGRVHAQGFADGGPGGADWTARITPSATCGVVVADDTVLVDQGAIRAHDAVSGTRLWTADPDLETVGALAAAGDLVLAVDRAGLLTARDRFDGAAQWSAPAGGQPLGTPAAEGETVVVGGGTGIGLGGSQQSGYVRVLALRDGARRWFANATGPLAYPPTVAGERVVVATTTAEMEALDLATGARRWRVRTGSPATSAPVQRGDLVVVAVEDGLVSTYRDLGDAARRVAATPVPFALRRTPAVTDDRIVLRADSRTVVALDLVTHEPRWRTPVADDVLTTPPTVAGDRVLVGGERGVHVLALSGGEVEGLWPTDPVVGIAGVGGGGAVVCEADGDLVALG